MAASTPQHAPEPLTALKGKIALVLGGTRGVGRAVTEKLAVSGADVVAVYATSSTDAESLSADCAGFPGSVTAARGDARQAQVLNRLLADIRDRYGRLDILVHSVASMHPMSATGARLADLHMDIAAAVDPLAAAAGPAADLMTGPGGRIIAISASVARAVAPRFVSLGAAKAAMESTVRYLAAELAGRGITVNAVAASKLDKGAATTLPEVARMLAARTPAGRLATPQDVADVVGLLCLPEAQWIQGQVLTVDGGLHLIA